MCRLLCMHANWSDGWLPYCASSQRCSVWKLELRMQHLFAFIVHSPEEMPHTWAGHTLLFFKWKQNYVTFSVFLYKHTTALWVRCNKTRYQTVLHYLGDTWMVAQINGEKIMPIIHQHMCTSGFLAFGVAVLNVQIEQFKDWHESCPRK